MDFGLGVCAFHRALYVAEFTVSIVFGCSEELDEESFDEYQFLARFVLLTSMIVIFS